MDFETRRDEPCRPTRRELLRAGGAGLVTLVGLGSALSGKVVAEERPATPTPTPSTPAPSTPALEEGPFWIAEADPRYRRADLRTDIDGRNPQAGLPLNLRLTVSRLRGGAAAAMPSAFVYLWAANAVGVYSGEGSQGTAGDSYLRGYQVTDAHGGARFTLIYPGWYGGRTVHIHARVRTYPHDDPSLRPLTDFETQLFFDDAITDRVMSAVSPYNQRPSRDTTNADDHVYNGPALDGTRARAAGAANRLRLTSSAARADAAFHMLLNTSLRARPGVPPGFGGPPGGPPPDWRGDGPPPPPPPGEGGPPW